MLVADPDHPRADRGEPLHELGDVIGVVRREEQDVHQPHSTRIVEMISRIARSTSSVVSARTMTYPSPS